MLPVGHPAVLRPREGFSTMDPRAAIDPSPSSGRATQAVDDLEYLRGVLCALSYLSDATAREVHVMSLQRAFARIGRENRLRFALSTARFLSELQDLPGGYWIPTPIRAVPVGSDALVVAPHTTRELRRNFGLEIRKAGYGRLAPMSVAAALPKQALESWLEFPPANTPRWAAQQLLELSHQLRPTQGERGQFEVFCPTAYKRSVRECWVAEMKAIVSEQRLCRRRLGQENHTYFIGRVEAGRLVAETPPIEDWPRMQIGLLAIEGRALTAQVLLKPDAAVLATSAWLPRAERRFLLAVAKQSPELPSGQGRTYLIDTGALEKLTELLTNLGCRMETIRHD